MVLYSRPLASVRFHRASSESASFRGAPDSGCVKRNTDRVKVPVWLSIKVGPSHDYVLVCQREPVASLNSPEMLPRKPEGVGAVRGRPKRGTRKRVVVPGSLCVPQIYQHSSGWISAEEGTTNSEEAGDA